MIFDYFPMYQNSRFRWAGREIGNDQKYIVFSILVGSCPRSTDLDGQGAKLVLTKIHRV